MALQKAVGDFYAEGIPGDRASLNTNVYTTFNPLAETNITAGTFVWAGNDGEVTAKHGGSGTPMGFVERVIAYPDHNDTSDGTMVIPAHHALTVARKGDYYCKVDSAVDVGDQIYAIAASGKATGTSSGNIATGWYAKTAAAAQNDVIIISNW